MEAGGSLREALRTGLGLIPHPEGGYFRETWRAGAEPMASRGEVDPRGDTVTVNAKVRNTLTSIYWMVTREAPVGYWICNASDHVHYWHGGGALTYHVVDPATGAYTRAVLGPDAHAGEVLQFPVRGGHWKAAELSVGGGGGAHPHDFCLIGEAVAPGWDSADFRWGTAAELEALAGAHVFAPLAHLVKPDAAPRDFAATYAAA